MISHHGRKVVLQRTGAVGRQYHRNSIRSVIPTFTTTTIQTTSTRAFVAVIPQDLQQPTSFVKLNIRQFSAVKEEEEKKKEEDEETVTSNNDSSSSENKQPKEKGEEESFQEMLHRMENDGTTTTKKDGNESSSFTTDNPQVNNLLRTVADKWSIFSQEIGSTWTELIQAGAPKDINKKLRHPEATPEGDKPYTGPVEIMVIDESEHLTAWERMQRRLTDAPIIQDVLSRTEEVYEKSGAKNVKKKVDHLTEDAREAWETSQNPWVYRISSVYETITAETPESIAVKELRILDPEFTLDEWREDVVEHTLPQIMSWFLQGKINQLKPWLGEGVFKRIAAEITARQKEGVQIDTHVLGIMNSEIVAIEPDEVNKGSPIILLHFMCQQINCVRKKEDGTVVEGSEDDIRANSYVAAFQREYNEEAGELNWKIVDFRFNGAIAYL